MPFHPDNVVSISTFLKLTPINCETKVSTPYSGMGLQSQKLVGVSIGWILNFLHLTCNINILDSDTLNVI
jgi:hypothetical protein